MDPDAFESVPRDMFPSDMELIEGMELHLQDQDGGILAAFVAEIHPETVLLDFNHSLAGEALNFEVKVVALRPATAEEIAHGHALWTRRTRALGVNPLNPDPKGF